MPALAACGRHTFGDGVVVRIKGETATSRRAGLSGVVTCGSVWCCPVCNAKIASRRAADVQALVEHAHTAGNRVVMLTLTMRHHRGQALADLWAAKSPAWARARSGKSWVRDQERYGIEGWVSTTENTWGPRNGHHLHMHVLLVVRGDIAQAEVNALGRSMWKRWAAGLVAHGLQAPTVAGLEAHLVSLNADERLTTYLAKSADSVATAVRVGLELTATQSKSGRARSLFETLSMWEVGAMAAQGDRAALAAWREFEQVSRGRRQMSWSQGVREAVGLGLEESDEAVAAQELGTRDDDVAAIERTGWRWLRQDPRRVTGMLDFAEAGGPRSLFAWLVAKQVPHRDVRRHPPAEEATA